MREYRARCVALTGVCCLIFVTLGLAGFGSPPHPNASNPDGGAALVAVQMGVDGVAMRSEVDKSSEQIAKGRSAKQKWPFTGALISALAFAVLALARFTTRKGATAPYHKAGTWQAPQRAPPFALLTLPS
ncbi:MAG: hypothetical protein ABJD24_00955 [Acidimicrobiales bacterium]